MEAAPNLPRQFWQDTAYQRRYTKLLDYRLGRLEKTVYSLDNLTEETASSFVNNLYGELKKAIHDASSQCSDEYIKQQPKGRKVWWTKDCTQARKRSRLFFHIWKSIGRPSSGATYQCYNEARKNYRRTCRRAVHKGCSNNYRLMDSLYKQNHAGRMWNLIRKSKNSSHSANPKVMALSTLEAYFGSKFKANEICDTDREAFEKTFSKHKNFIPYDNFTLSHIKVKNYIKQLKNGCAGELDCLVSQYLQSVPSYWSIISWISVVIFIMTVASLDLLLIETQTWLQHYPKMCQLFVYPQAVQSTSVVLMPKGRLTASPIMCSLTKRLI